MVPVWKKRRVVKTGMPTHCVGPCEVAIVSDEFDISETSNSAYFSCRKNISEGCSGVMSRSIPSAVTVPSMIACERALGERAQLSFSFAIPWARWRIAPELLGR